MTRPTSWGQPTSGALDGTRAVLLAAVLAGLAACAQAERGRPYVGTASNVRGKNYLTLLSDKGTLLRGGTLKLGLSNERMGWVRGTEWADRWVREKLNCVRLALNIVGATPTSNPDQYCYYYWYPQEADGYADVDLVVKDIDHVVDLAAQKGLYIVINYHNPYQNSSGNWRYEEWIKHWRSIAPRYADRAHVIYEPINEYMPAEELYLNGIRMIREAAPATPIVHFSDPGAPKGGRKDQVVAWGLDPWLDIVGWHAYGTSEARLQELTDIGFATLMTEHTGDNFMWCEERGVSWIAWDGQTSSDSRWQDIRNHNGNWQSDNDVGGPTNQPPTVSISSPQSDATLTAPATITIKADASDSDGSVTKVEFYQGSTKLGEDTSSPYEYTWRNVAGGRYTLAARATDSEGATGWSSPVNVTVNEPPGPYGGAARDIPARVEAEDYNTGGEGIAYHDTTAGNSGGQYRSDDVDIQTTSDAGGGFNVGWIAAGEWLAFDVNVTQTGTYRITARVAAQATTAKSLHIELDGQTVATIDFQGTGGWQSWTDAQATGVELSAGSYELKVVMDTSDFNLNYVDFELTGAEPPSGEAPAITGPASLAGGLEGQHYSVTFEATGDAPINWSRTGSIPPGMSLDPDSGAYSGTPTAAGSYNFTVTAENDVDSDSKPYTHVIEADSDLDGLSDSDETDVYHTDPDKSDTDGDGMSDGDEVDNDCDPLDGDQDGNSVLDGNDDWDGDGVDNATEFADGTSPGAAPEPEDSGGDGGAGGISCAASLGGASGGAALFALAFAIAGLRPRRR